MNMTSSPMERLRDWPELWRHPALFCLVHSSVQTSRSAREYLQALFADEASSREDAWTRIIRAGDAGAAQIARDLLAVDIGITTAEKGIAETRAGFRRRVQQLQWRAHVLSAGRTEIQTQVQQALDVLVDDPAEAERQLAAAELLAAAGEERDLDALAQAHPDRATEGVDHLQEAIAARDLRLAYVYAGHLGNPLAPSQPLRQETWLDRTPVIDLLTWRLNSEQAPARLASVELADHEILMLALIEKSMAANDLVPADAEQIVKAIMMFAAGKGATLPVSNILSIADEDSLPFAFELVGGSAMRIFPLAADENGTVVILLPRNSIAAFPAGWGARRFVAFDLFDQWNLDRPSNSLLLTVRMLMDVVSSPRRVEDLVRLQSRAVAVRPLVHEMLGRDIWRARSLAGLDTSADDLPIDAMLSPMLGALDLYVDEIDILALDDACGGDLNLLLKILSAVTDKLNITQVANRRFDAAGVILSESGAALIDEIVEADLVLRLGERRDNAEAVLAVIDYEIEQRAHVGRQYPTYDELAQIVVDEGWISELDVARSMIDWMADLSLLFMVQTAGGIEVHRRLGLPYRILLHR
ncbi:MAG: hypothetical protein WC804_06980 [Sphingomonas sp.]|jgi:hypothetical protein|uniref:hypothetical protein n=1 Tax=Sphingomonas sp. TaxID=28214 RepID=UPI003567D96E